MFENLTDKLSDTFRRLSGQATLNEKNVDEAMREIRLALLDADVNFKIVKQYIADVREECLGIEVTPGVNPGEMTKATVHNHLVRLMGEANVPLTLAPEPAGIMMVGLHGSGKTTTTGKLAVHLRQEGKRPLLVAADLQRPAAIDQLETLGRDNNFPVYADREVPDIAALATAARMHAQRHGHDVMIFDTAGRLQVADDLIQELVVAKRMLDPTEVLLVADAALGQEAVAVAESFDQAVGLTGIVLTKLDGDARGGAALSMRATTGKPIKLVGVGEKMNDLQPFHPDRMADRILGMGDVATLVDNIEQQIDEDEARELEEKMLKKSFNFNDFLSQLKHLKRLGGLSSLMGYLPGMNKLPDDMQVDESMLRRVEGVIHSMTEEERRRPELLQNTSRRKRIAAGAGRPLVEVQQLISRFDSMKDMMSEFGKMSQNVDADGNLALPMPGQGLLGGVCCLDGEACLSPGQAEEIDRVIAAYPHLTDDDFVAEHLDEWLSG